MTPFLKTVAADLYAKTGGNFDDVTIIFPNKRAGIFFNQYLAELNGGKPMWLPNYVTITDIFSSLSPLTIADPVTLVCLLYQTYCKTTGSTDTLDKFYSWGEIMLQDFDDIDNNLIPADKLFTNASDLSDMTDLSFMSESQVEAVRTYFENFNPERHTKLKDSFMSLWNMLLPIYNGFRNSLESQGLAYEGMLKRTVAEQLKSLRTTHPQLTSSTYAIVGFNVLNQTETTLFRYLKQHHDTNFYWDYIPSADKYDNFEADRFIKQNIAIFGNEYSPEATPNSSLHIIASPTDNAQARYVEQWLRKTITPSAPLNRTAIVLCDESLLQSVVHSIPPTIIEEKNSPLKLETNITMGLPLTETSASSLLQSLLSLQLHGQAHTAGTWHHDCAVRVLRHPFVTRITNGKSNDIISELRKHNVVYPHTTQLSDTDEFLTAIFTPQTAPAALLRYLSDTFETIGKSFKECSKTDDFLMQLHIESVFNIYTIINRFTVIYQSGILNITAHTLSRLLTQAVASKSVPFHGEPATGLQVMGMLETRNLDFDNIIILSANEGNLPKAEHITSLIPYTLREAYGMTTIEKRTSLYAYYFHRLIRRATNIHVLYNTSCDNGSRGEISRFLLQLTLEGEAHPTLHISQKPLIAASSPMRRHRIRATKDKALLTRLSEKFTPDHPLTPSALNTYIDCPLKFYLSRLSPVKLTPLNDIDEDIDNAQFGDIVHHVMEAIYKPFIGRTLNSENIKEINNRQAIEQLVDTEIKKTLFPSGQKHTERIRLTGRQLLNRHVIVSYIQRQLSTDANSCPLRIISLEDKEHTLTFPIDRDTRIHIGGIIDRMDTLTIEGEQRLRIADYKTSATPHKATDLEQLFDSTLEHRPYHILQALTYSLLLSEEKYTTSPIAPTLLYLKQGIQASALDSVIKIGKEHILDFTSQSINNEPLKETFMSLLRNTLSSMLSSDNEFTPTKNPSLCEYCDFNTLCHTSGTM